jgi:hypothetical protein
MDIATVTLVRPPAGEIAAAILHECDDQAEADRVAAAAVGWVDLIEADLREGVVRQDRKDDLTRAMQAACTGPGTTNISEAAWGWMDVTRIALGVILPYVHADVQAVLDEVASRSGE